MRIPKINELINLCKKVPEIRETVLLQFFPNVNRIGISLIWMWLKSRKVEFKQRVKASLTKGVVMFHHDCNYKTEFILKYAKQWFFWNGFFV